ncbi:palmitoyl-acyl carrier protein thioesterase, chloroplastic-like [Actinidia eriantha]|uniref:palmitoyl-acyl carrier protein thioesterase, chloroplastic-like n=1 Tax=Actinidia eriantha TaxID=165200 RepID=UPI002588DA1A|nr:palmitoyl-acyl carrier protein thioesterase, chloroplastic-like [Actinidia eriantha]
MTTMASTKSISIYYADDLCRAEKRNVGIFKLGFSRLGVPGIVREKLVVQANLGGSSKSVDMINGKKVNGVVPSSGARGGEVMKQGGVHEPVHAWLMGTFVEDRFVYRQTFVIRSYEIGPDKTATMETLMNLLQETALNHVTSSGLAGNGFGATREMSLRKLIWVVTRIHVQVDKYSSWGDVVEIDTWVDAAGKNGMRRDWIIRDRNSQRIITRATSTWVIMNRETRRLSKIPDEVRKEVQPFYLDRVAIPTADLDCEKIDKLNDETADRIRSGLAPRWSDMDANQHVNNVKYIGWILESVPIDVLEDYNLTSMTLEYRRECRQSNVLESLTTMSPKMSEDSNSWTDKTRQELESTHLLRMQADKAEIVRARSVWQSKHKHMI